MGWLRRSTAQSGEYDSSGNMTKAQPMTHLEFLKGVPGDELRKVFEDGEITLEQNFTDIKERAKIQKLDDAITEALENLYNKVDFLQKMSSPEAIATRLAEAACGSKWGQKKPTKLEQIKTKFPKYAEALDKIGAKADMDTEALMDHIRKNVVCDKTKKKSVFRALADGDVQAATGAMGGHAVLTL